MSQGKRPAKPSSQRQSQKLPTTAQVRKSVKRLQTPASHGLDSAKAHDWTPVVKWVFRFAFLIAVVLILNRGLEEARFASIGRDICEPRQIYANLACAPDGTCLSPTELRIVGMQMGLERHRWCRLGEPVTIQDHVGRLVETLWTPAQQDLDGLDMLTAEAVTDGPEPPSLKPTMGQGGPEVEAPE